MNRGVMDVERIREDFPIFKRLINGKLLVYLDNAATSQKPNKVIEALSDYYRSYNANVHRAVYKLGEEATMAFEEARAKVARFINAEYPEEVVFTRGTTEGINLVAYSWGRANIRNGDSIILTEMEHHSNIVPWQLLIKEKRGRLEFVGVDDKGLLKQEDYEGFVSQGPKLVSFAHVSNVLGTINPAEGMVRQAHKAGALVLIDAAQSVPHMPVDVQEIDCDFLAFSGHKMLAPTGIGVLYGKRHLLEEMEPLIGGGHMIKEVHLREARWNDLPWKFEAGTSNISGAIGLGAAVEYLNDIGMKNVKNHEEELTSYALETMGNFEDVQLYGPRDAKLMVGVISFNLGDIHPHDVATVLDQEGIAIRSGHHCAQPLMERLGVSATSRTSFYIYNTAREVDIFIQGLDKARRLFKL